MKIVDFPWTVDAELIVTKAYTRDTPLGRAAALVAAFEDCTVLAAIAYPGGARFARISPETDWAIEERIDGETAPEIAEEMDEVWQGIVNWFFPEGLKRVKGGDFSA